MVDAPLPPEAAEAYERGLAAAERRDVAEAERQWRIAAEAGHPRAAFELGYLFETREDWPEAERWHRLADERGDEGGTLGAGVAVEKQGRVQEAMELFRRAWERGEDKAAFNLGRLYDDDGKGDLAAAAEWYGRAADKGNAGAAYNLGHVRSDQGDEAGKVAAWERARELKHPKAAFSLAFVHVKSGDEDKAVALWREAVEEFGDAKAAENVGTYYLRRGDQARARFWNELPGGLSAYSPQFESFAAWSSAAAIHRQDVLNEAVGEDHIQFDMDEGTLTTGGRTYAGTTSLGSYSHLSKTWLWSWANPALSPDVPALARLSVLREYGRQHDIPELVIGHIDLSGFPQPHQAATTMTIAAAMLLGGNGMTSVRINDGKGSAYFHLDDERLPAAEYNHVGAPGLLMRAVEVFPSDARHVVRGFMRHHGFVRIRESADVVDGTATGGQRLTVGFTDRGLIKSISSGNAEPPPSS
ncbi:DUF6882 domain-containing protein [Spirillospora sp. NPDC047279]|uniref:tetratricopeptide repeat protein n=1 Tax=Spirillospora sp. NPDC047279 TaxID=3155478 RepID=UPI0033C529CB